MATTKKKKKTSVLLQEQCGGAAREVTNVGANQGQWSPLIRAKATTKGKKEGEYSLLRGGEMEAHDAG